MADNGDGKFDALLEAIDKMNVLELSQFVKRIEERYGVSAAACSYFSSPLADLTLGQYALLAGVTQAPSIYDPRVNPEAAAARRAHVLQAMLADGYITASQAAAANHEPVLAGGSGPAGC